jgi:hypothetical protein
VYEQEAPLVPLDLFVASRCPDASECETAFLPDVLKQVCCVCCLPCGRCV